VVDKAPFDYDVAQEALRQHFAENPVGRSFFILNLSDGRERLFLPSGQSGCSCDMMPPPIVLPDGRVLAAHLSKEGSFQQTRSYSYWGNVNDWSIIDFQQGRFRRLGPTGSRTQPASARGDDFYQATVAGDYLFANHSTHYGISKLFGESKLPQAWRCRNLWREDLSKLGTNTHRIQGGLVSITPLDDVFLMTCHGGICVAAFESAAEQ